MSGTGCRQWLITRPRTVRSVTSPVPPEPAAPLVLLLPPELDPGLPPEPSGEPAAPDDPPPEPVLLFDSLPPDPDPVEPVAAPPPELGLPVVLAALVELSAPGSQSQVDQVPCTQVRVPTQPFSPVHWAISSPLHLGAEVDDVDEQLPHSQGRERTSRTGNPRRTMAGVCDSLPALVNQLFKGRGEARLRRGIRQN